MKTIRHRLVLASQYTLVMISWCMGNDSKHYLVTLDHLILETWKHSVLTYAQV